MSLARRTVNVTNLNFKPEQHGEDLVERVDLSLEVLLEADDVDDIVLCRVNPLKALWDSKGEPALEELKKLELDLRVEGKAELGLNDEPFVFEGAVLKKVTLEPLIGHKATMRCQVRVDPNGTLEELAAMVVKGSCAFSFEGHGAAEADKDQGQLNV